MKINIPEKYTDLYVKALEEKKRALQIKIQQFKLEIAEIDTHLSNLNNIPLFDDKSETYSITKSTTTYHEEWPWTKKIAYYIDYKAKLVKTNEVVEFIVDKEPQLIKAKVRSSVSAALSNKIKKRQYKKFEDPVSGHTYYGPSKFFINNNEPGLEYMPEDLKDRLLYNK